MTLHGSGGGIERVGLGVLRYGLVFILLAFGALKWTAAEAATIEPWVKHSPFMSWMYEIGTIQQVSIFIGVVEIVTALLIAARRLAPRASAVGGAMATGMFLTTLSFLVTTPGQGPEAQGFLLKDLFLLGTAIWILGESLRAASNDN